MSETGLDETFPALPLAGQDCEQVLNRWALAHAEMLELCAALEEIADSLPASINKQNCICVARAVLPLIRKNHRYEEDVLFARVERSADRSGELAATLSRLRFEHFEDECFAEELTERLLLLGAGTADVNMEATGYMLRGFFEAVRRHVAFERELLFRTLADLISHQHRRAASA